MLRSIPLAAGVLGLTVGACVDSGSAVIWPDAEIDVGFLVTIDALGVPDGIIEGPFAFAGGSADRLSVDVISIPEGGDMLLIEVGPERLDRADFPEGVELRVDQIPEGCVDGVLASGRIQLSLAQAGARVHVLQAGQFVETSLEEAPASDELVLSFVSAAKRGCDDVQLNPRPFGPGEYGPAEGVTFRSVAAVSTDRLLVAGDAVIEGGFTGALFWVRREGKTDVVTSPELENLFLTDVVFAPGGIVVASAWGSLGGRGAMVHARVEDDEVSIIGVERFDHALLDVSFDPSIPLLVASGKRGFVLTSTQPMGPYHSHSNETAEFDYLYALVADMGSINTILSPTGLGVHSGLIDDPAVLELELEKVKAASGVDLGVRGLAAVGVGGDLEVYAAHEAGAVLRRDHFEDWVQIPSPVVLPSYADVCIRAIDECGFPRSTTPSHTLVFSEAGTRALVLGGCSPIFVIDLERRCVHAEMLDGTPSEAWTNRPAWSSVARLPDGPTFVTGSGGRIYELDL